jgi:hypothetical protein
VGVWGQRPQFIFLEIFLAKILSLTHVGGAPVS